MILALGRFKIGNEEIVKKMEKEWKAYQAKNRLDLYGDPKNSITIAAPPTPCWRSAQ